MDEKRKERRGQIEEAAYAVLSERGYCGSSMLEVAKRARASNETLYRWYGDKIGLLTSMIEAYCSALCEKLPTAKADGLNDASLERFGAVLLTELLSERMMILTRAAAAEATGSLQAVMVQECQKTLTVRTAEMLALTETASEGTKPSDIAAQADDYLGLLLGDLQARRVMDGIEALDAEQAKSRSQKALQRYRQAYSA